MYVFFLNQNFKCTWSLLSCTRLVSLQLVFETIFRNCLEIVWNLLEKMARELLLKKILRRFWTCSAIALELRENDLETASGLMGDCSETAMQLLVNCPDSARKMCRDCCETARRQPGYRWVGRGKEGREGGIAGQRVENVGKVSGWRKWEASGEKRRPSKLDSTASANGSGRGRGMRKGLKEEEDCEANPAFAVFDECEKVDTNND